MAEFEVKSNELDDQRYEGKNVLGFGIGFTEHGGVFDEFKEEKLRSLFDEFFPLFLKELPLGGCVRPLPALLDGQPVDLFELFYVVKRMGGFECVSMKGWWDLVTEECELSGGLVSSVKLIYIKYLKGFDAWVQEVFGNEQLELGEVELFKKLDLLIVDTRELRRLMVSGEGERVNDGESNVTESYVDVDRGASDLHLSDGVDSNQGLDRGESCTECGFGFHDIGMSEFFLSDGARDVTKLLDNVQSGDADGNVDLKFDDFCLFEVDINRSECLVVDDGGVFCKLNDNVDGNEDEKYSFSQGGKNVMLSAKTVVDKVFSSQKSKSSSEVEGEKVQDVIIVSGSDDDDEKLGARDDYYIMLSAKSIVEKVVNSGQNGSCSWTEGDNTLSANVDEENVTDNNDGSLFARICSDEVVTSEKKPLGDGVIDESGGNIVSSRKRKRESIAIPGMLNWLSEVAKHPDDPALGKIPAPSTWKEHGVEEFWMQALLARKALLVRRPMDTQNDESLVQKKLKMHPSMYDDKNPPRQTTERVRCSKRFQLAKSYSCSCCKPSTNTSNNPMSSHKDQLANDLSVPAPKTLDGRKKKAAQDMPTDETLVRQVSVGPNFQADVPEWTGVALESDAKWLGTQMWSPKDGETEVITEQHYVGKGRESICYCVHPGSSECVRFHIAEKRVKLKLELGVLFYRWRFDRMGEGVSLSWTPEEENRFKIMMQKDSAAYMNFWPMVSRLFPTRTRENLVGYYFNVFVLRGRMYQNRVTPKNIDSDDDETDLESVVDSGKDDGSNFPLCVMNMQHTDFQ